MIVVLFVRKETEVGIMCSPTIVYGRHGNGKPIQSHKRREFRSWKYNRKTKWK